VSEGLKTSIFCVVAVVLAALAYVAVPPKRAPGLFVDQGELFYPEFDQESCKSVQVVSFDPGQTAFELFRVEFDQKGGGWIIPSHENYPADAQRQLVKMTTIVNGLRKGAIRSDRKDDLAKYSVLDPLDQNVTGPEGCGKRLTLTDGSNVLADLVVGSEVDGSPGQYYVRRPDSNRVYACKLDAYDISTRFADWVETDVLQLSGKQIKSVTLDDYHVDEQTATKVPGDVLTLTFGKDSKWQLQDLKEDEELDEDAVRDLKYALQDLILVDVRRKPANLLNIIERAHTGQTIGLQELFELQDLPRIGYYPVLGPDNTIRIVSNDGEMRVGCEDGVAYALLFGEVVLGEVAEAPPNDDKTTEDDEPEPAEKGENRYLWVRVDFDESLLPERLEEPEVPQALKDLEEKLAEEEPDEEPQDAPAEEPAEPADVEEDPDDEEAADAEEAPDPIEEARKEYRRALAKHDEEMIAYEEKVEKGRRRAEELKSRFAEWYYVVSADAYRKLDVGRDELVKPKKQETDESDEAKDEDEEPAEDDAAEETDTEPTEND
jgi:hypothetical protein